MPRSPIPAVPPSPSPPEPWVAECRAAAAASHRVPAFVPRPPVPDASPRGLRRAARRAAWALAALVAWLVMSGALLP